MSRLIKRKVKPTAQIQAGNEVKLKSGRDIALKGAQVDAGSIVATVGRDLTIESLQNTSSYKSSSVGFSFGLSSDLGGYSTGIDISPNNLLNHALGNDTGNVTGVDVPVNDRAAPIFGKSGFRGPLGQFLNNQGWIGSEQLLHGTPHSTWWWKMMQVKMEKQLKILDDIAQILHNEADCQYENLICKFEVDNVADETMDTTFHYTRNGEIKNVGISENGIWALLDLILELHKDMKNHTGGDWSEFTLTIDENGQAKTKFKYPDQEHVR